jgi:hypothetical protein
LRKLKELTGRSIVLLDLDFTPRSHDDAAKFPKIQPTLARLFTSPPSATTGFRLDNRRAGLISPIAGKEGNEGYILVIAPVADIREPTALPPKSGPCPWPSSVRQQPSKMWKQVPGGDGGVTG